MVYPMLKALSEPNNFPSNVGKSDIRNIQTLNERDTEAQLRVKRKERRVERAENIN
jgi:hypothetical protein